MAIAISLLLFAAGAVLRYAFSPSSSHGFNVPTVGVILMIVAGVGFVAAVVAEILRRTGTTRSSAVVQDANGGVLRRDEVHSIQSPL